MSRLRLLLVLATGVVIGLVLAFASQAILQRRDGLLAAATTSALPAGPTRLLAEVLRRVESNYVEPVSDTQLMDHAVRGMVAALDTHSQFLDAGQYQELLADAAGSYPGIGIEVAGTTRGVEILQPIAGSPAAAAGLRVGDVIIAIDGHAVRSEDLEKAIADLRGPAGSVVHITIRREGLAAPLDYDIRRAQVAVRTVSAELPEGALGYLRIQSFNESTAQDVAEALHSLAREAHGALGGLVLDLRNNPGGLLESAVEIADDFLERGNIVSAEGRTADARFRRDAKPGDLLSGAPIVVIVNGDSASAAEILAGALKDNHRAQLVGRRSYGKGSVQTVIPLSDGQAVKLTTSRYFTPSGASINQVGIQPDVAYEGEEAPPAALDPVDAPRTLLQRDPQIALAFDLLRKPRS